MKILTIIIFTTILLFNSSGSFADTKDCSQYSKNNLVSLYDNWRCKQGKGERKKLELGKKLKSLLKKN